MKVNRLKKKYIQEISEKENSWMVKVEEEAEKLSPEKAA